MDNIDDIINQKVCKFYPGDPNNCVKDLPMFKIKLVGSILIILLGIMIFRNSTDWITKVTAKLFSKFAKLIGITLIVVGLLILNKSVDSLL
jgi:hypothetical protein